MADTVDTGASSSPVDGAEQPQDATRAGQADPQDATPTGQAEQPQDATPQTKPSSGKTLGQTCRRTKPSGARKKPRSRRTLGR